MPKRYLKPGDRLNVSNVTAVVFDAGGYQSYEFRTSGDEDMVHIDDAGVHRVHWDENAQRYYIEEETTVA